MPQSRPFSPPEKLYARADGDGRHAMIRGVHHIGINVRDFDRMLDFYQKAFGFEVVGEPFHWEKEPILDQLVDVKGSAAKGAMLRSGSVYMEMFQYSAPDPKSTRPLDPQDKGYTHMCIDVTDIEKEFERLKGLGMTFGSPEPLNMGHVKSVYGRDPEGNVIEIQETLEICEFPLEKGRKEPYNVV
jgi:catechol 2,3-dioxygenase-like lactoylglutathione lyase family enzyme